MRRGQVVEADRHPRLALQQRVVEDARVVAAVEDEVGDLEPVRGHETARAARDLQDHRLGVTGAEGVDHTVGADAVGDQLGGAAHVLAGGLGDVTEDVQALFGEALGAD